MKFCPDCKETKLNDDFFKQKKAKDGLAWSCKECDCKRRQSNRNKNFKGYRNTRLKLEYGMSQDYYEFLLKSQNGMCAICKTSDGKPLCVDHNHESGLLRGLLCNKCNMALGLLKVDKNSDILINALNYTEDFKCLKTCFKEVNGTIKA